MIPAGVVLTLLFVASVLFLPRRLAALGVMASVCYITQGQSVTVAGFHLYAVRIVLLAALLRLIVRRDFREFKANKIDWAFLAYVVVVNLVPILRERTSEEMVFRLGTFYDVFLSYWVFRGLLTSWEDVEKFFSGLAFLIVPLALEMILESQTHRSLFEPFGGIGELTIREGRPRAQGAFRIGITAGVFGAALIPLFISLYRFRGRSLAATVGLLAALVITYTSNSSGPLMAALCGFVAWLFWPMRTRMKKVRWGIVAVLLLCQLTWKVPVWFIFSKLGALTGGDGWHRSYLIDRFIHFFPDWWLMGTENTGNWMPTMLADGKADITDFYVAAGLNGGLLALVLLILIMVRCFRFLGLVLQAMRAQSSAAEALFWGLGGALFSHVVTLFSVTYWDQLYVALWACVAIISSVTANVLEQEPAADSLQQEQEMPSSQALYGTMPEKTF